MRLEIGILVVAVIVGLILYVVARLLGLFGTAPLVFAAVVAIGVALCVITLMAQNAVNIRELVKQVAIWLGVVTLLPLAVWYGTSAFSPPPDWKKYGKSTSRIDEKVKETKDA